MSPTPGIDAPQFDQAGQGEDPVGVGFDSLTLRFLDEALRSERLLSGAIYAHDPASSTYAISSTFGIEPALVDRIRGQLLFRTGEERGFIGIVASRRESVYVPDCAAEPRWFNEDCAIPVGSAYVIPIVGANGVPAVVSVISASASDFLPPFSFADQLRLSFGRERGDHHSE